MRIWEVTVTQDHGYSASTIKLLVPADTGSEAMDEVDRQWPGFFRQWREMSVREA